VKPGNLRERGAKSGGDYREMRLMTKKQNPSVTTDFFVANPEECSAKILSGGKEK